MSTITKYLPYLRACIPNCVSVLALPHKVQKRDAHFSKLKNISNLISDDREGKIIENIVYDTLAIGFGIRSTEYYVIYFVFLPRKFGHIIPILFRFKVVLVKMAKTPFSNS